MMEAAGFVLLVVVIFGWVISVEYRLWLTLRLMREQLEKITTRKVL